MRDRIVNGILAAVLGVQPLLLALGMDPELAAAIVSVVGAFYAGYKMNNAEAQGAVKLRKDLIEALTPLTVESDSSGA